MWGICCASADSWTAGEAGAAAIMQRYDAFVASLGPIAKANGKTKDPRRRQGHEARWADVNKLLHCYREPVFIAIFNRYALILCFSQSPKLMLKWVQKWVRRRVCPQSCDGWQVRSGCASHPLTQGAHADARVQVVRQLEEVYLRSKRDTCSWLLCGQGRCAP